MAEDVIIKDMGWSRAVDRLAAMGRARVDVGIFGSGKVAKYSAIHEHRFGWRKRAERMDESTVGDRMSRLQAAVVDGSASFRAVLTAFALPYINTMRASILGELGGRRLFLTGAMVAAVKERIKVP